MLYKQIVTVALSASLPSSHGSIYYVSANATANYTCPDTTTCSIYCDTEDGGANEYHCNNAAECEFHCDEKKCAANAIIDAKNSNTLSITQDKKGQECLSEAIIYTPNNGDAHFSTQSKKGYKKMTVYAGTNSQSITIDTSEAQQDKKDDDYKDMNIYASTAQHLNIFLAEGLDWPSGTVECPLNSAYSDASCVIEARGALGDIDFTANDGITFISDNPTPSPTKEPTKPTQYPTKHPTAITESPTLATIAPTNAPTQTTSAPSNAPTPSPSNAPTIAPSNRVTSMTDDDSGRKIVDGFVLSTPFIMVICIAILIAICCLFICIYYYRRRKARRNLWFVASSPKSIEKGKEEEEVNNNNNNKDIAQTSLVPSVVFASNYRNELEMRQFALMKNNNVNVVHGKAEECEQESDSDDLYIQSDNRETKVTPDDDDKSKDNSNENEEHKVSVWMENVVKLGEYTQLMIENGFDSMDAIGEITMEDLVQMGIQKMGHRHKIFKLAKQLNVFM